MKKGFTLVELMAVIILLAVICAISFPVVNSIISSTKQEAYDNQVLLLVEAGKKWGIKNVDKLPLEGELYITIEQLLEGGFIENGRITNPKDNTEMTGCVLVKYISEYNQYSYEYKEKCE